MNYAEATRYLISLGNEVRATSLDQAQVAKLGLENITALLTDLGRPQEAFPSVLVGGTNGKGSVAAMLEAALRSAGLRTGLYTSPHLVEINERIQCRGRAIPPGEFGGLFTALHMRIERLLAKGELRFHPTYFECLTAMGFEYFRREACEMAVVEVGMGGRLDATNTANPRVAVITQIDLDHERFLGTTIRAIAGEKAGIIKRGRVVVSTASHPEAAAVIRARAEEQGARLVETWRDYSAENVSSVNGRYSFEAAHADGFRLPVELALRGRHQVENALAAVGAARELARLGFPIGDEHVRQGLATARWPGRLEAIREEPLVLLDGAHNPAGARALARFAEECLAGRRVVLVYGAMRDKAVPEIAEILFPRAELVVLTRPEQFRTAAPETVRELAAHLNANIVIEPEPEAALARAVAAASPSDVILVTGSLFLVGDIKRRCAKAAGPQEPVAMHSAAR
jgi:dihydrofolate synthase/folylpolyglutamate synthase